MKIGEAERWLQKQLLSLYEKGESNTIAIMVMEHITGLSKAERLFIKNEPLDVHQLHYLTELIQRLQHHEPVQYVLGECWFAGLKLFVNTEVLIPRPETEELVDWVIKEVAKKGLDVFAKTSTEADETSQLKILDVGTGSGCIALALKNKMPRAEVWGCDLSEEALNIARRNGAELNIRVDFQAVDFLEEEQQKLLPTVDVIISNPPYIPVKEAATMANNVVRHEPHLALFVPDNEPLVFYKAIARFGKKRLYNGGSIFVEIHEALGAEVVKVFEEEGYSAIELRKDMQDKDRMVKAMKQL